MTAPTGGLRILHLAFEDRRQPASGGGAQRTWEINRRLAARHEITVVTARYPGATRRVEDGLTYLPLGLRLGRLGSLASYHLAIPVLLALRRPDLVVEDFAAPMSSSLVPLWTGRPTVAVVQWLAARETSRRYRLPFWVFEEAGMRLHGRFVAVSEAVAARVRQANPGADTRVVYAGVDRPAGAELSAGPGRAHAGPRLLWLGRLEWHAKGLDLLFDMVQRLRGVPGLKVTVAGDGADRPRVEAAVDDRGLAGHVELVGRVEGIDKWRLLEEADAVVITSRYESFGLVAAEAMVAGTPVVAWELPSLREIVPPEAGELVAPFDADALAAAAGRWVGRRHESEVRRAAKRAAERFDWDRAAAEQEEAYLAAFADGAGRGRLAALRRFWAAVHPAGSSDPALARSPKRRPAALASGGGAASLDGAGPELVAADAAIVDAAEPAGKPRTG